MFHVGITPDFYVDAKGHFEEEVERLFGGVAGLAYAPMPDQPGKVAASAAVNECDAILAMAIRFTRDSVRDVGRLAVIARWGVGYDMIDVAAMTEADIALAITPNGVRRPVAEAIITLIFALAKNLREQDHLVRTGRWRDKVSRLGSDLPGKVLGSMGCGNIAREMFRIARPLGFGRLLAFDPFVSPDVAAALGVELVNRDTVFRESDFVAVNTPLTAETRGMVGARDFALMKPTAFFINTARGPIVQQDALVEALRERRIAGAGLDVFTIEPPSPDDPLLQLDNVVLAPHALAWTHELARDNTIEACENILAIFRGETPAAIVNREVLARPRFQEKLARFRRARES